MSTGEIHCELLLGCIVRARNGRKLGRVEEMRVERRGEFWEIVEFQVGYTAGLRRLDAIAGPFRPLLAGMRRRGIAGYRIRWDQLDLSDPERPTLLCTVDELERDVPRGDDRA